MKNKTIINSFLLSFGFLFLGASHTLASSVLLSPTESAFSPGQSITMTLSIDPSSSKIYTSKIALKYPADLLEVESFSFSSGWQALTQSGYDLVDNTKGSVIKTAGFTGGVSNKTTFGTVKFRVKKVGVAKVSVTSESALYDENNKNVLSGSATSIFTVLAPVAEPEIERLPVKTKPETVAKKTDIVPQKYENIDSLEEVSYKETYLLLLSIITSFVLGFVVGRKTKNI